MLSRTKRWLPILSILALMLPLLTGCLSAKPVDSNEPKVLKILGYDEQWLRREWTQLYEIAHPNVTIEFMNMNELIYGNQGNGEQVDPNEKLKEILTGPNPPDLIFIDEWQLENLIKDNLLQPLEPFIEKDKFDLEGIVPVVREGIRNMGDGTLYALAANFSSNALAYNKSYFDEIGIAYPENQMTWEDAFNLARSLKGDKNGETVYGLSFGYGDPFYGMQQYYLNTLGLSMYNEDFTQVQINDPQWERAWQTVIDIEKEEVLAPPYDWEKMEREGRYSPFADNDFLSGRAAMMIVNYSDLRWMHDVMNNNRYYGDDVQFEPFEFDVVTLPVHPETPEIGGGFYVDGMMAINANAQNAQVAWEFISYMNSDQVAKVRAKSSWNMVSRKDYIEAPPGLNINMEAFYLLAPAPRNMDYKLYEKYPNAPSIWELNDLSYQQFNAARKGEKTVKEALNEIEVKGQELLERVIEENKKGPSNFPGVPREEIGIDPIDPVDEEAGTQETEVVEEVIEEVEESEGTDTP